VSDSFIAKRITITARSFRSLCNVLAELLDFGAYAFKNCANKFKVKL